MVSKKTKKQKEGIHPKLKVPYDLQFEDGYSNFRSNVGLGARNNLSFGRYYFDNVTRNREQLESGYRTSWIIGQLIDCKAEDMTRSGIIPMTNEDRGVDLNDLKRAFSVFDIQNKISSAIKWSNLYGGALLVLNIEGQLCDQPLNLDSVNAQNFNGFMVYDRWQCYPELTSFVKSGKHMGLPEFYNIYLTFNNGIGSASNSLRVHHSRCVRFIGKDLPFFQKIVENYWGESVLEPIWDKLIAFDQVTMSAAGLVDKANSRGVKIEGLRDVLRTGGPALSAMEKMFDKMAETQSNENVVAIDTKDDFFSHQYTFTGLPEMILQFLQQISGASGIPLIRLMGQSPVGLNATGDSEIRLYYDKILAEQESKTREAWDLVLRVLWRVVFKKPHPKDLSFTFTSLWQMPDTEKASVASANTNTVLAALNAGLIDRRTAAIELREMSRTVGIFGNISDQEIDKLREEEPPKLSINENDIEQ